MEAHIITLLATILIAVCLQALMALDLRRRSTADTPYRVFFTKFAIWSAHGNWPIHKEVPALLTRFMIYRIIFTLATILSGLGIWTILI
jgi:hypothetical protein